MSTFTEEDCKCDINEFFMDLHKNHGLVGFSLVMKYDLKTTDTTEYDYITLYNFKYVD